MDNERTYLSLLGRVLSDGNERVDRTNTGTISLFGQQLQFDISKHVPVLTTKHVAWKSVIKELLWFLRGDTNVKNLQKENVKIWDLNTSRSFLDDRGLDDLPEGDMGAGYGFQWRHFGAEYKTCTNDYNGIGFDQINYVTQLLKTDCYSRRIFMSAWNPASLDRMALPPCHVSCQFYVEDSNGEKHLSCHLYQRSVDVFLGLPFNMLSYSALTYILAKQCGMKPNKLVISTGDTHIYKNHVDQVKLQLSRDIYPPPNLVVSDVVASKKIESLTIDDFCIENYVHHAAIKADMCV